MSETDELHALYEAKARAELGDADAFADVAPGAWRGEVMASVALVVGALDAGGTPLGGAAGEAAGKALAALGFAADTVFVVASRPPGGAEDDALAGRLRLALEAVDPTLVLALDAEGARDLQAAYGLVDLPAGQAVSATGRTLGYVGDLEASLGDDGAKAPVWRAMKKIAHADAARTSARRQSAPREKSDARSDRP